MNFEFDFVKDERVFNYASVFINASFFIIGGHADRADSNTIARLDTTTWSWSRAGSLNTGRRAHGVIWANSRLVVVGGYGTFSTEFCNLENDEFVCTDQQLKLKNFNWYPLLFAVTDDNKNC